jgi:uncharacterized membrane protein YhaH (DUF805 family)
MMDPNAIVENFRRNLVEHYFDMKGRVGVQEFWYFVLVAFGFYAIGWLIDLVILHGLARAVITIGLLLPLAGLGARRLQDTDKNGALVWIWIGLLAFAQMLTVLSALIVLYYSFNYGPFFIADLYSYSTLAMAVLVVLVLVSVATLAVTGIAAYLWAQPGNVGPNQYGPDPKAR